MFSKILSTAALFTFGASEFQHTNTAFVKYFDYEGDLAVSGAVEQVSTTALTQTLYVNLQGLDTGCESGPSEAGNSCGIHIHAGMDCTSNAGGHYYDANSVGADPWSNVIYTPSAEGDYMGSVEVTTGYPSEDITGHAFIVHNKDGGRIACAVLAEAELNHEIQHTSDDFVPYFNYEGDLAVSGAVEQVSTTALTQTLYVNLRGLDTGCESGPSEAGNSCGIHIHAGMDCTSDAGGHYYDAGLVGADPWSNVIYTPSVDGYYMGSVEVTTGYPSEDITGHAFIVHNKDGGRIACAVLTAAAPSPDHQFTADAFQPYFNYEGDLAVSGEVTSVVTEAITQHVHYALHNLDPDCESGPSEAGNSCGIHIHAGMDCTSDAGGHYYKAALVGADPWSNVIYTPHSDGSHVGTVTVTTGYPSEDITGHAFIVHDKTGARVACSVLQLKEACGGMCGENTMCVDNMCVENCPKVHSCCTSDGVCDDTALRQQVGKYDGPCEEMLWDQQCVEEAQHLGFLFCGGGTGGGMMNAGSGSFF